MVTTDNLDIPVAKWAKHVEQRVYSVSGYAFFFFSFAGYLLMGSLK